MRKVKEGKKGHERGLSLQCLLSCRQGEVGVSDILTEVGAEIAAAMCDWKVAASRGTQDGRGWEE